VRALELKPIIESTIETVRPAAAAKEIELNVDLHADVGAVSGDPDRLQQLVWNLLSNAIKFTPQHGRVDVTLAQDGSDVEIVVRDSGQGIKAEFLPHVFERFRQADGSTARKYGGLGLGLAIVRHLTELHGGTVAVESEGEERGSTFRVTLPQLHRADESLERPVELGAGSTNGLSALRPALDGVRILVVDDEADVREFAVMTFQECGAEAVAASSLAEAMNIIGTWKPNVLVADIGMPDEDGYALIRRVRSLPAEQGGRIPAMALTAYARTEDRVRILSSGYQIHVAKPVEPVELITAVASLAGRTIPE
jgi:CheY-like chemotaxis protein